MRIRPSLCVIRVHTFYWSVRDEEPAQIRSDPVVVQASLSFSWRRPHAPPAYSRDKTLSVPREVNCRQSRCRFAAPSW